MADPVTAPTRGGADEIREQMARWLWSADDHYSREPYDEVAEQCLVDADDLIEQCPALAPLLALRQRVWNLAEDGGHEGWISAHALYDLLDGTP